MFRRVGARSNVLSERSGVQRMWAASFRAPSDPKVAGSYKGGDPNPYKSWEHMNHKWMVLMCLGCLGGGAAAGHYAQVDEDKLNLPKFDEEEIRKQLRANFEVRPDIAATCIRVAFVMAARRAGVESRDVEESCSVTEGLRELAGVMQFSSIGSGCTMEDVIVLAALEAVIFLKGPHSTLSFNWGRKDEKNPSKAKKRVERPEETPVPQPDKSGIRAEPKNMTSSTSSAHLLPIEVILKGIDSSFTVPEMVALLGGCHSVGEFHDHVAGVGEKQRTPNRYTLDNRYFQVLLKHEKNLKRMDVPRSKENEDVLHLPKDMMTVTINSNDFPNTAATSGKKHPNKRVSCAFSGREVNVMLQNKAWRAQVEVFAKDREAWATHFESAFQKLIDSNVSGKLRPFPKPEEAQQTQ